jgi:uncharacterized repeat protein (TIGR01451 family)
VPVVGTARLAVTMTADRKTVPATGTVTYTITVHNYGGRPYTGQVSIQSHIPAGTTEEAPAQCQGGSLPSNPNAVCEQVTTPVPGSTDPNVHQINQTWTFSETRPFAAGGKVAYVFTVRVDPDVASGTVLEDHAHMTAVGSPDQTTDPVRVMVQ